MKTSLILFLISVSCAFAKPLKVITSTTDLAWAAREIGKDKVDVTALLAGTENPHYVDTIPEYIRLASEADVVCIIGLELEVGWMPKVLARSGNAQVQPGGKGYCETGKAVTVLEKPTGPVDRSMGDIHVAGNPHFWLSPKSLTEGSQEVLKAFVRVDPAHSKEFEANYKALSTKLEALHKTNQAKLKPYLAALKGPAIIEYHKEFSYFFYAYEIQSLGSIEEKPGVPPSAGRIAEVALTAKSQGIKGLVPSIFSLPSVTPSPSEIGRAHV